MGKLELKHGYSSSASSSSDSEDESDSDNEGGQAESGIPGKKVSENHMGLDSKGSDDGSSDERHSGGRPLQSDESSDSSSSDSDSNDEGDDSGSDSDSEAGSDANSSNEESSSNISREDEESLPLAERIQRQNEQGVDLAKRRERKSKAILIANERLKKMREEKQKHNNMESARSSKKAKKKSKHAPTEASSKRADFFKRSTQLNERGIGVDIGARMYKPRDPRSSSLSGHLNAQQFDQKFAFLQEMREKEIETLKKKISAFKTKGRKGQHLRRRMGLTTGSSSLEEHQEELKRLLQEKSNFARNQLERTVKQRVKKKLQQDISEGKRGVYYPKRSEMKRLHLEAKFEELRKRGGDKAVDKALAKRRKKNKSRDSGHM